MARIMTSLSLDDETQKLMKNAPRSLNWSALLRVNIAMAMMEEAEFFEYISKNEDARETFNWMRENIFNRPAVTRGRARMIAAEERSKQKSKK